jgi:hypothetical protein
MRCERGAVLRAIPFQVTLSFAPMQMFTRKFQRIAEAYPNVTFLEIFGDDTKETRVRSVHKLISAMCIAQLATATAAPSCTGSDAWLVPAMQKLMISMSIRVR